MNMHILVYVTADRDRYLGGDPLSLFIEPGPERQKILFPLAKSLKAEVLQLENGDHLIVKSDPP
jgi:hypothetical protein